jgi:hypothetical protein
MSNSQWNLAKKLLAGSQVDGMGFPQVNARLKTSYKNGRINDHEQLQVLRHIRFPGPARLHAVTTVIFTF